MNWKLKLKSDWGRLGLTSNYEMLSLGELVEFVAKGIPPKYASEKTEYTIAVLNQKTNRNFKIDYKLARLNDLSKKKVPLEKMLKANDILINSTGVGTAGRIAQLFSVPEPTTVDSHMLIVRADTDKINPIYLGYALKAQQIVIEALQEGSTGQTELNRQRLLDEIEISFPSEMKKQEEIAKLFLSLDNQIAENEKINHHLSEQSRAIFQNLLDTTETNLTSLKEIATIVMGQSPKGNTYNNDNIGLPLLNGAADFRGGISPSKWTSEPKKTVSGGEYIFGVRATIGLTTKVFKKYAIGRGTGSALAKDREYDEFLYFVLEQLFEHFDNSGSGTVYINISKSDFDNFKFDLPKKEEISLFHETVSPLFDLIYNNNSENERLTKLRDTLLPKLMSGETLVKD